MVTARNSDRIDLSDLPGSGRLLLAFSGGPDSVCLLHLLLQAAIPRPLLCLHIDHGMDPLSGQRALQARQIAEQAGADFRQIRIQVQEDGRGLEQAARSARYAALASQLEDDETLLTAHHADDQVETVLLRLLRGAGPAGLAGIPRLRPFHQGWLYRPLLDWRRSDILSWLEARKLPSVDDPDNRNPRFDRNHLRHHLLPQLRQRWPGADIAILRSARLCRDSSELMARQIMGKIPVQSLPGEPLRLDQTVAQNAHGLAELIRAWCLQQSVPPPPGKQLDEFVRQRASAGPDRIPELAWTPYRLRLWRDRLWLDEDTAADLPWSLDWDGLQPLQLPGSLGWLKLEGPAGPALALRVQSGQPGERLQPASSAMSRPIKQLLAEADVPPWQRHQWPRLWQEDELLALGDRWLSSHFAEQLELRGQTLRWQRSSGQNE